MDKDKKYALLDTDFLYKSHLAKTKENHTLADLVMGFEEYEFFCHEMIKEELTRHEIYPDPNPWLEERIQSGRVKLYSDRDIICELSKVYGDAATSMYMTLLESSCEIFNAGFLKNQTDYKAWSMSGHQRISVPIQQVYDEIYDGKFQLLKNGDLKYIK